MQVPIPFTFDHTPIRAIEREGEAWFIAVDVCAALGITSHRDAVARLDADERGSVEVDTPGGRQTVAAINEAGLYTLTLRSRDAMTVGAPAHRFRKWVTGTVLPALRKHGHYGQPVDPMAALADPAALRGLLLGYSERVLQLEARNEALEPQAAALERLSGAHGSMSVTAAAKALKMGPRELGRWLRENRWTYRSGNGERVLGYQSRVDAGLIEHRAGSTEKPGGGTYAYEQVLITPKGLARLASVLTQAAA